MTKSSQPYLKDIVAYCDRIIKKLTDKSMEDFRNDIDSQDAVIRRFEIIGEAVKRIPDEIKNKYPDVPWKNAAGFRDVLIHDYPDIVIDQVYITGKEHLPVFKNKLKRSLKI